MVLYWWQNQENVNFVNVCHNVSVNFKEKIGAKKHMKKKHKNDRKQEW